MRKLAIAVCAAALVVAMGCATVAAARWPRAGEPAVAASASTTLPDVIAPIHAAAPSVPVIGTDPRSAAVRTEPTRVQLPDLGIDMKVAPFGLTDDRAMALPASASSAAWYKYGAIPGDEDEAALIAAHVGDTTGLGPFSRLGSAIPGTAVSVALSDGSSVHYTIVDVAQVSKQRIDVAEVLANARGMLVLVTCGGRWNADAEHYEDNVLAWAMPSEISWSAP